MATLKSGQAAQSRAGRDKGLPVIQPVTTPSYAPAAQNVTPTTPSIPQASVTPAPTNGRDFAREQAVMKELGFTPKTPEEQDLMYRATYSPEELKRFGLDQQFQGAKRAYEESRNALMETQRPTNTGLRVLQDALNAKSNITNQPIGESKMFEKAGLGGYEVLRQSMAERSREMDDKYNSFKFTVSDVAGAMSDTYNIAADRYKLMKDEYDMITDRANEVLDNITKHERALELLQKEHELRKEIMSFENSFDGQGEAAEFTSDVPMATGGQFKNRLTGTGTITAFGSSAWKPGLDLAAPKGSPLFSPGKAIVRKIVNGHASVGPNNEAGKKQNGGFGNQVVLELADGNLMFISHLDAVNPELFLGKEVNVGDVVGNMGNTGFTMGNTGVHADVTMKPNDGKYSLSGKDGNLWTAKQVAEYIAGDMGTSRVPVSDLPIPESLAGTLAGAIAKRQSPTIGGTVKVTEPISKEVLDIIKESVDGMSKKEALADIKETLEYSKKNNYISAAIEITDDLVNNIYEQVK